MAIETNVALLGYGTVGAAVGELLTASAPDIERSTGRRVRLTKVLVRDPSKPRSVAAGCVVTTDFAEIADDPSVAVVAEVIGGLEPAGTYVLELLRRGKHVVTANKQLVARRADELAATAASAGVALRFEASVCAAIPVVNLLRDALVATHVHRVLGIVNGTTNFVLTEMERGASYADALAEAHARGYAEADPSDDVSGADAAAKMTILASAAFDTLVPLEHVEYAGIDAIDPLDVAAARELEMVVRLVGAARLDGDRYDVRVEPALVDAQHPLAKIDGAFNAVMLQGDAIRELTLVGPGAGGIETASAVVADIASVVAGTGATAAGVGTRDLARLPPGDARSPFYFRLLVEDRPGALASVAQVLAEEGISIARLVQHQAASGATLHVVTHEAAAGALGAALRELEALPEVRRTSRPFPVVSDRGVAELGWA